MPYITELRSNYEWSAGHKIKEKTSQTINEFYASIRPWRIMPKKILYYVVLLFQTRSSIMLPQESIMLILCP